MHVHGVRAIKLAALAGGRATEQLVVSAVSGLDPHPKHAQVRALDVTYVMQLRKWHRRAYINSCSPVS